ncbi:hypothetical protein AC481_02670 [miscellaneous Crenarchaeota group archaeon SMTZ-80]|nr:MAG: hypothetical protein AC481_02670 [miscellaneous Crenarchaeota group archaeon SMTZ-80]
MVKKEPIWRRGLLDLAAAFFLIGGVVSLMSIIMMVPIRTVYPFKLNSSISFALIIILIVGIICAIQAFECYKLTSNRMLIKAGIRGIVIGAILLSIGLMSGSEIKAQMVTASAILILVGGVINYIYRE